ncbi:putative p44-57 outer membrane protein, silent [Anaplasma phagocytophilum str. ApNP]|uniref:Putative p44-57 outer membrane protein, silent n=2 Tax=Anaplasma phagocytophilum TaxID=948 RepID=A0A0F3NJ25_ANAPH|nr:putative p44-57 outer membrane protein, silent [Anaplasma phagocytophilum str. ApMUC09]KJV67712.1 putative p44-57 outer membrane protein, silent [Anaplasma phagocytophilum str. ApNP]SCV62090.1 hypothetical protein ANAPH2_00187 [Anaplasma phagocytophilum]
MEISHPKIDDKVCVTKKTGSSGSQYGKYGQETANGSSASKAEVAVCGAGALHSSNGSTTEQTLKEFIKATLLGDGSKNWPTSTTAEGKGPAAVTNDNAEAVAKDLTKLTTEEKTIVAGLLAKTIEGGEVVEIRAVSSTFVSI